MATLKNKTTKTQNDRLLKYLMTHKRGITTYQGPTVLGIYRLSARIADLRARGHQIDTLMHREVEEDGTVRTWAQYILKGIA
jgi:hypothetical protein